VKIKVVKIKDAGYHGMVDTAQYGAASDASGVVQVPYLSN
jgi:hypothetical protein